MSDKIQAALEQVTFRHALIGLLILIFMISGIISYYASQSMYYEIIEQKILRDKSKRLSDRMATDVAILFYYSTSS